MKIIIKNGDSTCKKIINMPFITKLAMSQSTPGRAFSV